MKTMVLHVLEDPRPGVHNPVCFNVLTTVDEYLNRNVSFGQFHQHISKDIVICARSRPKMLTKTYNKEGCQVS